MKRYDSYKDSGVKWIGEIPSHWKEYRLKYLLSRSAAGVWGDDEKEDENDIVCFRIADFDYGHGILKFDNITYRNIQKGQLEGRQLSQGDLLIEKSGGGDATPVGRVVRFNYDGEATCSNFIHSISVKETSSSNFLYYFFYSLYANKENLLYFNQTTGIQNLKVGEYLSQSIFLPELGEQKAIAEWLDVKCGEIDKLIATQQRRIELLQELRQSIITRAVTRGINPDAPLRDSGIDWIGQIPTHWDSCRLKFILHLLNGRAYAQNELLEEGKYKVLRVGNFFTNSQWYYSDLELEPDKYCHKGDLLYAWSASFGPYIWDEDNTIYHYHIWKVLLSEQYEKKYAYYVLDAISNFKRGDVHGSTMTHITMDSMNNSVIPLPPLNEQREIVAYIEQETTKVDHALQQAERQIELLQELRQSVITEVVTGKRKVC